MPDCLIALGANLGDRAATLDGAVDALAREPLQVVARSRWLETAPVGGPGGQGAFLNGAIRIRTDLAPLQLLEAMDRVEAELGRQRRERWAARTLDLDLLLYDDLVLESPRLMVPHPRMALRRFVLEPAAEVAPDMVHPILGWSIARLLQHLDQATPYLAIAGLDSAQRTRLAAKLAGSARVIHDPAEPRSASQHSPLQPGAAHQDVELARRRVALRVEEQIPLVRRRAQLLDRGAWPSEAGWTISDFWFDQPLAQIAPHTTDPQLLAVYRKLHDEIHLLRDQIVQPKLLVHLQQPDDMLNWYIRQAHQRQQLGPVLTLPADDEPRAVKEILAALEAMQ